MIKSIRDRICANRDRCRGQASCWATNRPSLAEPSPPVVCPPNMAQISHSPKHRRGEEWVSPAGGLSAHLLGSCLSGEPALGVQGTGHVMAIVQASFA